MGIWLSCILAFLSLHALPRESLTFRRAPIGFRYTQANGVRVYDSLSTGGGGLTNTYNINSEWLAVPSAFA